MDTGIGPSGDDPNTLWASNTRLIVIGAFDSRVHDVEDVARLDLPVLGHVPGFPGDNVGSLEARGALRARVPSFLRWRSHR